MVEPLCCAESRRFLGDEDDDDFSTLKCHGEGSGGKRPGFD